MTTAKAVPLDVPVMTDAGWQAYYDEAYVARLDAKLEASYLGSVRRLLGALAIGLATVSTLGGLAAVGTIIREQPTIVTQVITIIVAVCSVLQTILKIPDRITKAQAAVVAWEARHAYWTDVVNGLANGWYYGDIAGLRDGDLEAVALTEELGFPSFALWKWWLMRRIEMSDHILRRHRLVQGLA